MPKKRGFRIIPEKKMTTLKQLRKRLGLKPKELIQSSNGQLGDLLDVTGGIATISVIGTGEIAKVSISDLRSRKQAKKEGFYKNQ